MAVKEADPAAKSLDEAFAEAMGAPARPKEPPPPKDDDPDAPHGRGEDGQPLAPFGLTRDGKVRKSAAGRPPKEDQARTGPASTDGSGKDQAAVVLAAPGQYLQPLSDTAESVWFGMSALAKVGPGLPLIGARLPAVRIQAQAAVWYATKDRAVAAVSLAAEHNASAARFAAKLEGGDITWMITCLSLVAPIVSLSGMVWSKDADAQLAAVEQPGLAELAAKNEKAMDNAIAQMTANAQLLAAAAEQQAAAAAAAVA